MLYVHRVNTINEAYQNYYKHNIKSIELDVQITQDNKVIVYHDDVSKKRLKQLKNTIKSLVSLEEYLKHTPEDMEIIVEIKRYDDKDYAYRVIHACEQYKPKKYIYASFDRKFCKHIQCMKRPVFHLHETHETLDPYFKQIGVHVSMLQNPHPLQTYEGVYVWDVKESEYESLKTQFPWVKGWIVDLGV